MSDDELLEQVVATALTARDPGAALAAAARDSALPDATKRHLAAIDEDGFRIAALLVARLRFERLLHGHPAVAHWLEHDAEGLTEVFRRYHAAIAPTAFFPPDEARLFDAWLAATGTPIP